MKRRRTVFSQLAFWLWVWVLLAAVALWALVQQHSF